MAERWDYHAIKKTRQSASGTSSKTKNEMMKKLFDGFLEQPNSGIMDIAAALGVAASGFSRLATTWSFVSC